MRKIFFALLVLFSVPGFGDSVFVELSDVPADGFVVCPLDITPAANWLETDLGEFTEFYCGDKKIDAVFVPDHSYISHRGTFVADEPVTSRVSVRLDEIGLESNAFDDPLTFEPGVPLAIEVSL